MSDYVSQLEAELIRAGRARQQRHARLGAVGRLRPGVGGALTAAASIAAAAVAVLALVLAGHDHGRGVASGATGAVPGPAAHGLESKLAVLRRPQTASDRALEGTTVVNAPPASRRIPGLTRLVATVSGVKVYLVVNAPGGGAWSPQLGDQVGIVTATPRGAAESPGIPAAALGHASRSVMEVPLPGAGGSGPLVGGIQIVPDSVDLARVVTRGGTSYAKPSNNVIVLPIKGSLSRIDWLGTGAHVVSSSRSSISRNHATTIREYEQRPHPTAPALLRDFATFAGGDDRTATVSVSAPGLTALPAPLQALAGAYDHVHQPNLTGLRHVTTPGGVDVWFIPARRTACFAESTKNSSTGACARNLDTIEAKGVWTYNRPHGAGFSIVGIVPKTNTTVTATLRSGGTRTVPVLDGVVVTPAHDVKAIELRSAAGRPETVRAGPEIGPAVVSLY